MEKNAQKKGEHDSVARAPVFRGLCELPTAKEKKTDTRQDGPTDTHEEGPHEKEKKGEKVPTNQCTSAARTTPWSSMSGWRSAGDSLPFSLPPPTTNQRIQTDLESASPNFPICRSRPLLGREMGVWKRNKHLHIDRVISAHPLIPEGVSDVHLHAPIRGIPVHQVGRERIFFAVKCRLQVYHLISHVG